MTDGRNVERRLAHERLSTGALARWMRACATHPWRVFLAWGGIVVLLVILVIAVGGGLKDEFEIPGSDTQRATDLIESEFAAEQGAVLNLVFAAPEGESLDTPERREAIEGQSPSSRRTNSRPPRATPGSRASAIRSARRRSPMTGASRTPRRSSARRSRRRIVTRSSPSRTPCASRSSRQG